MKHLTLSSLRQGVLAAVALAALAVGAQAGTVFLSSSYNSKAESSSELMLKSNGKVYDSNGKFVGHLTDTSGNKIDSLPANGDYQIRKSSGQVIAGSNASEAGLDNKRSAQLNQEASGSIAEKSATTPDNPQSQAAHPANTGNVSATASGNVADKPAAKGQTTTIDTNNKQ